MAARLYNVAGRRDEQTIQWDDLLLRASREHYGIRGRPLLKSPITRNSKDSFLKRVFSSARSVDEKEPMEISANTVDVNEKVYTNTGGHEDETTIIIVNSQENTEGRNYRETTTKGIKWGVDANVGLQFGLPQVGGGIQGKLGGNFERSKILSVTQEKTLQEKHQQQSFHEETLSISPGKKATLQMTAYRVRYKLAYTMEYKIAKKDGVVVRMDLCGLGLIYSSVFLTSSQLLYPLPGYREDDEFVYFFQEGELRWIADRMVVKKTMSTPKIMNKRLT